MDEQTLWGILIFVYVAIAAWLMVKHSDNDARVEARKKLYPGREIKDEENDLLILNVIWGVGLFVLLIAYYAGWHPISATAALIAFAFLAFSVRKALKR